MESSLVGLGVTSGFSSSMASVSSDAGLLRLLCLFLFCCSVTSTASSVMLTVPFFAIFMGLQLGSSLRASIFISELSVGRDSFSSSLHTSKFCDPCASYERVV
uniref:Uncharacterized protein n=1 Tax=Opuntia streptacantha TaxID=393608 RepID=A0A7C9E0P6_OPUST